MTDTGPTGAPRVRIRRLIDSPPTEVFPAWTDADAMGEWMRPGSMADAECELDPREGGRFRIVMIDPEGGRFVHRGEYRVVEPPRRLVFTWISDATEQRESVVTVELFDRDGATELVLTHERLPSEAAAERHTGGWTDIIERLADRLEHSPAGGD